MLVSGSVYIYYINYIHKNTLSMYTPECHQSVVVRCRPQCVQVQGLNSERERPIVLSEILDRQAALSMGRCGRCGR